MHSFLLFNSQFPIPNIQWRRIARSILASGANNLPSRVFSLLKTFGRYELVSLASAQILFWNTHD